MIDAEIQCELTSPYIIFLWFSLTKLSSMFISTRFTYRFNCTCICDFRATSLYNLTCEVKLQITKIIGSSGRINTQFLWREIKESIRFNYVIVFKKRYIYLQASKERKIEKDRKEKKEKEIKYRRTETDL